MKIHTICEFSKIFISHSLIWTYHLSLQTAIVGYHDALVRSCSIFFWEHGFEPQRVLYQLGGPNHWSRHEGKPNWYPHHMRCS